MNSQRFKTTFIPTMSGLIYTTLAYTETGRSKPDDPVQFRYSVIRIRTQSNKTSVRTDMSGSQGRAAEEFFDARLLVDPSCTPDVGYCVYLLNRWYEVQEVQPKYALEGSLHHWQVDLDVSEAFE